MRDRILGNGNFLGGQCVCGMAHYLLEFGHPLPSVLFFNDHPVVIIGRGPEFNTGFLDGAYVLGLAYPGIKAEGFVFKDRAGNLELRVDIPGYVFPYRVSFLAELAVFHYPEADSPLHIPAGYVRSRARAGVMPVTCVEIIHVIFPPRQEIRFHRPFISLGYRLPRRLEIERGLQDRA